MKGNAYRKSDFHFYYPPRFSRGNFLALEIARNIREIAVIKDGRRSKRWIFPVFAPGTCSTGIRVNRKYVTRRTSRKIVKCTTFLRSSPAPDRTLFNRPIPRRSRVAPPCRFFDEDACLSIDAHVRSLKSGSFLYVRERCPPLSSARVLFYAARQVLLAAPRQRILLRSYNDVR